MVGVAPQLRLETRQEDFISILYGLFGTEVLYTSKLSTEMVNTEIPLNYTLSPSTLISTPHLTINRTAAFEFDSSNAFEGESATLGKSKALSPLLILNDTGPEKLLEVWFAPSAAALPASAAPMGLKSVEASRWEEMLDLVHCKILSVVDSEQVDAYLLSESSLFIFPHKLVLKTCGITTLLSGLPKMLEIAALAAGFPHAPANPASGSLAAATTHRVFYSRKNFIYPDQQRGPHRSWRDEVRTLDRIFRSGSAYMIGKMNGEHWYLYITEPENRLTPPLTPEHEKLKIPGWEKQCSLGPEGLQVLANGFEDQDREDETLEILMTDLDEHGAKQFYAEYAVDEQHLQKSKARPCTNGALETVGKIIFQANGHRACGDVDVFGLNEDDVDDKLAADGAAAEHHSAVDLTTEGHALGSVVSDACGLSDVYPTSRYPDARIDAYLFNPCGFSANGVVPAPPSQAGETGPGSRGPGKVASTHYFNVHVTPEPNCSYASFETNVPARQTGRETAEVVEQVVNIFRPGRFSVTLFEAKAEQGGSSRLEPGKGSTRMEQIKGYRRVDRVVHDLNGYDLVFRHYERLDWKGGAPRLGEIY